jgi:hypothetical protein
MSDFVLLQSGYYILKADGASKIILSAPQTLVSESFPVVDTWTADKTLVTSPILEEISVIDLWKNNLSFDGESLSLSDSFTSSIVKRPGASCAETVEVSDAWGAFKGTITIKQISNIKMLEDGSTSMRISRAPLSNVINKISVKYDRDWSDQGKEPYKKAISTEDSASILKYGEKEQPDLFGFDWVRSDSMAINLRDFYLARLKDRKKKITLSAFLDLIELEFSDPVTIVSLSYLNCEVQKVNIYPGSGKNNRIDLIEFELLEY